LKNKKSIINGGSRVIPKFHGDINTPFVTNDEKKAKTVYFKDREQQEQLKERMIKPEEPPKPLMSMTVMDSILGKKDTKPVPAPIYPSSTVPIPNPNNPIASTYMVPWNFNEYNVPIIKKYNISIQGADGNITSTGEIFEDILPPTHVTHNRMTTLGERQILYSYIRSILVKKGDGEQISFSDTNKSRPEIINLLSYMKMLEINPYHFSRLTNNPYRTMPDNFVMFRSCYPVRLQKNANFLMCAKESVGANIRIYSMSNYDELADKINHGAIKKKFSDVWREIMFYQYIREEILKKKICPHFPFLYSYYITNNTGIDFNKIKGLKQSYVDKNFDFEKSNEIIKNNIFSDTINAMLKADKTHGIVLTPDKMKSYLSSTSGPVSLDIIDKKHKIRFNDNKKTVIFDLSNNELEVDITKRSPKCLVALTEAPNQNIINWSTRSYVIDDGPIRKQLNTGIHDELTWKSVIFQILIAFYVMDLKLIAIKEMSWSRNIFIKDLDQDKSIGYWKYKIGGVDFFIPNMGYLVIIDSCFDDLKDGSGINNENIKFKLNAEFFKDNEMAIKYAGMDLHVTDNDIDKVMIDNFKNIFSPNVFSSEFTNYGGIKPPQSIINLITKIGECNYRKHQSGNPEQNLMDIILENFNEFLHNKVGKIISETEKPQLYPDGDKINLCKRGDLVGINFNYESYYWGIYIREELDNENNSTGEHQILTVIINTINDSYDLEIVKKQDGEIARVHGTIEQSYKPDHKISTEEDLLETYIISY
jgi:hypothetical protein